MTIRVGVFGAGGRMGALVCKAVVDDPGLELVATVDPYHAGIDLRQVAKIESPDLQVASSADEFIRQGVEVAVDFTVIAAAQQNLEFLAANGIHAVVGTTGFTDADYDQLRSLFVRSNCFIAPNFAIGSVLLSRFAALAAPFFETANLVEIVNDESPDAPTPRARRTASAMADASDSWDRGPDLESSVFCGPTDGPDYPPLHVARLRGLPGREEVMLGTTGQWLSMTHDYFGDAMFMPGVLLAVKHVKQKPGLTVGLDVLLGL